MPKKTTTLAVAVIAAIVAGAPSASVAGEPGTAEAPVAVSLPKASSPESRKAEPAPFQTAPGLVAPAPTVEGPVLETRAPRPVLLPTSGDGLQRRCRCSLGSIVCCAGRAVTRTIGETVCAVESVFCTIGSGLSRRR